MLIIVGISFNTFLTNQYNNNMIWEGDMDFWQPAEQPEVMIVGPTRRGGATIMTEGCSKGCQKSMSPESNHVITIITTSPLFLSFRRILNYLHEMNTKDDKDYTVKMQTSSPPENYTNSQL